MEYRHVPVMLKEVLEYLQLKNGDMIIDCTMGGAGYTFAIAERIFPKGKILSLDLDRLAIDNAVLKIKNSKFTDEEKNNIKIINENFKDLHKIIETSWAKEGDQGIDGIVLDLGLSSAQLEDRSRGFSFQLDAPLDMAFGKDDGFESTERIINKYKEKDLENIFREYGEEKFARRIAANIVEKRKDKVISTTKELVSAIEKVVPGAYRNNKKVHFATKTFQALRIATNKELESLDTVLPEAIRLLKPGGRLVVVSYHSLEDRIVKRFFKKESIDCICPKEIPECRCGHEASIRIITKKALIPTDEEISVNRRARSAKMRVAEKI
jgi:16S rRNA (cytosine1402-N4)-methyltransferase